MGEKTVLENPYSGLEIAEGQTVMAPEDYQDPKVLYDKLIKRVRKYHPSDDISMIEKAFDIAYHAHEGQCRKSGEAYIIHPLWVGIILAELELDKETIVAGILHDVVEDTVMTDEEITAVFGKEVALLVDGVTKLGKLSYSSDKLEVQAENLRKMFLAMAKDIRVILIKLADRLHNMRTLQFMREEKQMEKAKETLDIYAPLAQRLGISKLKTELDDLALKYSKPEVYYDLVKQINARKSEREEFVQQIVSEVSKHMENAHIEAEIKGRVKHFFSIYKKMVNQDKTIDQIYDLFAVRIIVDSVKDCYAALGVIHEMYTPVPGRFKDYIAMPKPNMYQSLHTTLMSSVGQPFEIQIRTAEMHKTAEYGIAAHWKYKESHDGKKDVSMQEEEKLSWLRQILEWQQDTDNREFLSLLKGDLDLFTDDVYCFTPNGDVKNLPKGSTPVDFAYSIHSAVGNKMVGARVNGKLVNIDYEIQNGDRIEVLTSQNSKGPSRDWLNIVKSTQARNKINQWFKKELKEENIIRGKELLQAYCKTKSLVYSDLTKPKYMQVVQAKYGFKEWEGILATVGHGGLKEGQVINRLLEEYTKDHKEEITDETIIERVKEATKQRTAQVAKSKSGIVVKGIDDMAVRFSRCCNPVPGDEIVGFVTRGRGMSIHRTDCVNIINLSEAERIRLINAEWEASTVEERGQYTASIKIFANNRQGLLMEVSKVFTENKLDISSINTHTSKQDVASLDLSFVVTGRDQLTHVIEKLRQIPGVLDIERTTG